MLDFDRGRIRARGAWEQQVLRRLRRSLRQGDGRTAARTGSATSSGGHCCLGPEGESARDAVHLQLLVYLLAPVVIAQEAWKALMHPEYRGRLGQRLGFVRARAAAGFVWVHAVSVGEVQAAAGLVQELRRRHPGLPHRQSRPSRRPARNARTRCSRTRVQHCYLPYDLPGSVRRFLDRMQPQVAIILETEIWPTLYAELGRRRIPLVLGSARVSMRSVGRYRKLATLFRETLSHGILIGAQTPADAERFLAIGAAPGRVRVTGNIKYDLEIPAATIEAGSVAAAADGVRDGRCGSPAARTKARKKLRSLRMRRCASGTPTPCWCWCRDIRSASTRCAACCAGAGCAFAQRSSGQVPRAGDAVFLVDTLGELQMFYAAADVAFVGGSLVPIGGHSLLEPAVLGLPMLSGPHTQNCQDIAELLQQCRRAAHRA